MDALAVDAQRLTARRQQRDVPAIPEQGVGQLGARVDDVLAVVQQQEQAPLADRLDQGVQQRAVRVRRDAEHLGHGGGDEAGVLQRGEIGEPHAVAGTVRHPGRDLEREPGLARAARAGERHQARAGDQAAHFGQLGVPADEARHLDREIVQQPRVVQRLQRREGRGQAVGHQLEDLLGPAEVLQPVQAKVPERRAGRHGVAQQGGRGGGEHDLPAVRDRRNAGRAVHVQADQADGGLSRLAGMHAHPDADFPAGRPPVRAQRPLHLDRRGDARAGRREDREEGVALGVDLPAVMPVQPGPDDPVVIGEDLRVSIAQALQHRGGTLDVSEEEGERLRGQQLGLPYAVHR